MMLEEVARQISDTDLLRPLMRYRAAFVDLLLCERIQASGAAIERLVAVPLQIIEFRLVLQERGLSLLQEPIDDGLVKGDGVEGRKRRD
jgi:hypothetical protein